MNDPQAHPLFASRQILRVGHFFAATTTVLVGDIEVGDDTNFWPFVVARGDVAPIRVGKRCSVQDFTMLHCKHKQALEIGDEVLIGHHACVHCRRVEDGVLVGIGSRILDESEVGEGSIVAAGAVVAPGTKVPAGKVVAGVPAKVIRDVRPEDRAYVTNVISRYVELARAHVAGEFKPLANWEDLSPPPEFEP